jgi:hypothetical protein
MTWVKLPIGEDMRLLLNYLLIYFIGQNLIFAQFVGPGPGIPVKKSSLAKSLSLALDQYLSATPDKEAYFFNNLVKFLSIGCTNDPLFEQIRTGNIPPGVTGFNDLFKSECMYKKLLEHNEKEKVDQVFDKILSINETITKDGYVSCFTDASCTGNTSCLSSTYEDQVAKLGGKGNFFEGLLEYIEETKNDKILLQKDNDQACSFNFECKNLTCTKKVGASTGICSESKICRLGRDLEKVKANSGACEDGLKINPATNVCEGNLTDENLYKNYNLVKTDLAKRTCGDFSNQEVSQTIQRFATDLRAFEILFMKNQNLSADLKDYRGADRDHYHKLPNKIQSTFLTEFLGIKKENILQFNKDFEKFNKNFENVLTSDGRSLDNVNFYDIQVIQKEMHSSKETAIFYLNLYKHWIESQQVFYRRNAKTLNDYTLTSNGFMKILNALAVTKYDDKTAPLFDNNKGAKNSKRWFLSLDLPKKESDYKPFYESPYLLENSDELKYSNFGARKNVVQNDNPYAPSNWYWAYTFPPSVNEKLFQEDLSNRPHLLDPLLPPGGCNIIENSHKDNKCGTQSKTWDWYPGTNGKFEKDLSKTIEKLYLAWFDAVLSYYQKLALNQPANFIIDPELNLYAGCIQQYQSSKQASTKSASATESVSDFYKNFCTPDYNKNGVVDNNEKVFENTIETITKKILAYSFSYSFNQNKRKPFIGISKSYKDEFLVDESSTLKPSQQWVDSDLVDANLQDTKFYNFKHGVKKKFLNRIRNKYFFMTQLYYLLGNNFDKQLKCISASYGFDNNNPSNVIDNAASPTAIPSFNPPNNNPSKTEPTPVVTPSIAPTTNPNAKNNDKNNPSFSSNYARPNSPSDNNEGFGSRSATQSQQSLDDAKAKTDEEKKSYALGGVAQTGSGSTASNYKDGNSGDYNAFGSNNYNDSTSGVQSGEGLNDQEQQKINAALNSNQEPQLSGDEDSIFKQITIRYVKNYKKMFRAERRSRAQ